MSSLIYCKTSDGQLAVKNHANDLSRQQRSVLIMIDGAKTVDDLLRFGTALGDVNATIEFLSQRGFIASTGAVAPVPAQRAMPVVAPAPDITPQQPKAPMEAPLTMQAFQREASRVLIAGLGPMGDTVCERLEKAKTAEDARRYANIGLMMLQDSRRADAVEKLTGLIARLA